MKYLLIVILSIILTKKVGAQDTITVYYDTNWVEIPSKEKAVFYRKAYMDKNQQWIARDYYKSNKLQMIGTYKSKKLKIREGSFTYYYENGLVSSKGDFKNDKGEGQWQYWYENGIRQSDGQYENGLKKGTWNYYNKMGDLVAQEQYEKGNLLSVIGYHPNGKISMKGGFKNGLRDGEWFFLNFNGMIYYKGFYSYGKEVGLWTRYFKDGSSENVAFANGFIIENKYGGLIRVNVPN